MKETIRQLAEVWGPSGNEEHVRTMIRDMVESMADDIVEDPLGNLIVWKRATKVPEGGDSRPKRIMVAAHMDEIGVIVTHIDDDGFLRVAPVGGISGHMLIGQRVRFGNGVLGVIGTEPVDNIRDLTISKLFVDIGAETKQEAEQLVHIGAAACLHRSCEAVGTRMTGKAIDDRVGCAILVQTLRELNETPHDVAFVFSVQEEVGIRGAKPATYTVDPDVGIAVDVTVTGDTPGAKTMDVHLGRGAAIKIMDKGFIAHPGMRAHLTETARQHEIPHQFEVLTFGTTDASAMHVSRSGVPSGVISIPTRYLHTPVEVIDLKDVLAAVRLLVATLTGPLPGF